MIIGKVIGNVVSTIKDPKYNGYKLLVVQEMNCFGEFETIYTFDIRGNGFPIKRPGFTNATGLYK